MPMSERQEAKASPSNTFPIVAKHERIPEFRILASSHEQNWHGVHLCSYWLAPQLDPVTSPRGNTHLIAFSLGSHNNMQAEFDGSRVRSRAFPGAITIEPHGLFPSYSWDLAATICHLYLSPQTAIVAAAEIGRRDPDRLELIWRFNIYDSLIEQIGLALLNEACTTNALGRLYAEALVQALSLHLLRHHSSLSNLRNPRADGLSRRHLLLVLDYINDHFAADITLETLASLAGLSTAYFARRFKQSTGMAPHQYLIQCRVERAKDLLRQDELTVTEIAHRVGFTDHSHLTRHFKRVLGILPRDFRYKSKNVHILGINIQAPNTNHSVE